MDYSFGYGAAAADISGSFFIAAMVMVMYLFTFGAGIVLYVLQSLGLYRIAVRRELKNPWLAWVPVGNVWMLGMISDQYQYVVKGKVRNRRKVILGLEIAMVALLIVMLLVYVMFLVNFFVNLPELDYMTEDQLGTVLWPLLGILGVCFVMEVVAVVLMVFEYIALYDIYRSCEPKNATVYLVLSILVPVTMAIFVFLCRDKDGGMPPKKSELPPPAEEEQTAQPAEEAAETEE